MSRPCSRCRIALGCVAVLFADDALELAEAHAVGIGQLRLRVHRHAPQRLPQPLVAHDDRVDDAELVEGVLILPQDAELAGASTVPRCGVSSPVSSFMNVDLPAPLGPESPYRRPVEKVVVTSSKSTLEPNRMETLLTEIMRREPGEQE